MFLLALVAPALAGPSVAVGYDGTLLTHPGVAGRAIFDGPGHLELEVQAGAGWHPGLMTHVHTRGGPALHAVGPRGGMWGAFAHVGVRQGFWTSPTFTIDGGEVRRQPLSGDTWLLGTTGVELGHTVASAHIDGWYVRPQITGTVPTFHTVGLDVSIEIGIRFGGAS